MRRQSATGKHALTLLVTVPSTSALMLFVSAPSTVAAAILVNLRSAAIDATGEPSSNALRSSMLASHNLSQPSWPPVTHPPVEVAQIAAQGAA